MNDDNDAHKPVEFGQKSGKGNSNEFGLSAGQLKVALHLRAGLRDGRCVLLFSADDNATNEEFIHFVEAILFSDGPHQRDNSSEIMNQLAQLDTVAGFGPVEGGKRFKLVPRAKMHEQVDVFAFPLTNEAGATNGVDYNYIHRAIDRHLLDVSIHQRIENDHRYGLTPRMIECLHWTAVGKTSEEIAIILELSGHTVNNYLATATQRLNSVNRAQAVARALSLGIISLS